MVTLTIVTIVATVLGSLVVARGARFSSGEGGGTWGGLAFFSLIMSLLYASFASDARAPLIAWVAFVCGTALFGSYPTLKQGWINHKCLAQTARHPNLVAEHVLGVIERIRALAASNPAWQPTMQTLESHLCGQSGRMAVRKLVADIERLTTMRDTMMACRKKGSRFVLDERGPQTPAQVTELIKQRVRNLHAVAGTVDYIWESLMGVDTHDPLLVGLVNENNVKCVRALCVRSSEDRPPHTAGMPETSAAMNTAPAQDDARPVPRAPVASSS